jgi:hypothetical protein
MKSALSKTLFAALFAMISFASQAQNDNMTEWVRVFTSQGRSLEIPKGWKFQETVQPNGRVDFIATNNSGKIFLAMYFMPDDATAGERMNMMISHNNIDVKESGTETYGNLRVMTKKGKMKVDNKSFNVLISTAEGAAGKFNVVGAFWGDQERFGTHKDKFPRFFMSLQ